jgi:hypothetical protein
VPSKHNTHSVRMGGAKATTTGNVSVRPSGPKRRATWRRSLYHSVLATHGMAATAVVAV